MDFYKPFDTMRTGAVAAGHEMHDTLRRAIIEAVQGGTVAVATDACNAYLAASGNLDAHHLLAQALLQRGDYSTALGYFQLLREIVPDQAAIAYDYGCALGAAGRLAEALSQWQDAVRLAPHHADACRNLAMGLMDTGQDGAADDALGRLLCLNPNDVDALVHRGNIRWRRDDPAGACASYRQALACDPGSVTAWINLGEALAAGGRIREAETMLRRAIMLSPLAQPAHFNLATILLRQRRWREGFTEYRWRANLAKAPTSIATLPAWDGDGPKGRQVALWNDQGFGDGIQFLRFIPALAARGHRPVLVLPPALVRLAANMKDSPEIHPIDGSLPPLDCQAALTDLPYLLDQCSPHTWWNGPYLSARPMALPRRGGRLAVGLVWAGNPGNGAGRNRTMPLGALAPLFAVPGIEWFSLQLGPGTAELASSPWADQIFDLSPLLTDFADTAAAICGLDLVISVDTSVAHLAGALARPVWVMLPERTDWRWLTDGARSDWYPSMRLFRRRPGTTWSSLTEAIAAELAGLRSL